MLKRGVFVFVALLFFVGFTSEVSAEPGACNGVPSCTMVTSCDQNLAQSNWEYRLEGDLTCDHTALWVTGENDKLDLRGHTITYGNYPFVEPPNLGFESSGGWTGSGTITSTSPRRGSYSLQFTSAGIMTSDPITVAPNRQYVVYGFNYRNSVTTTIDAIDTSTGTVFPCEFTRNQAPVNSWTFMECYFSVGSSTSVRIRITAEGSDYVDDVELKTSHSYGVALPISNGAYRFPGVPVFDTGGSLEIYNGTIKQGVAKGKSSNGIMSLRVSNHKVHDLNIYVWGDDSVNLWSWEGSNKEVYNNKFYSDVKFLWDREWYQNVMVDLRYSGGDVFIHDNLLVGGPHVGISADSNSANLKIYNNVLNMNASFANDYGISMAVDGAEVYNNTIIGNGRGLHINRANALVYNNFINVTDPPNIEYPNGLPTHAIQFEGSPYNARVYNNTVYSYAHPEGGSGHGVTFAVHSNMNISVFDNYFYTYFPTTSTPFANKDYAATVVVLGGTQGINARIYNNIFESNLYAVFFDWEGGSDLEFINNTFRLVDPAIPNRHFIYYWTGSTPTLNSFFINNSFEGYDPRDYWSDQTFNYSVQWYLDVNVLDGFVSVADGTPIQIRNSLGDNFAGTTTSGKAHFVLPEFDINMVGGFVTTTEYNNYTVNVTYLGETQSKQVNLTSSQTVTFEFNAGPCPDANLDGIVNIKDLAIVIFNQGRSATGNYAHLDFTEDGYIDFADVSKVVWRIGGVC